ncbi:MAG: response regulator transcription factor [Micrococcales bacterium]|nr:response regulator transcription factor [Micrococcales bacterium]
MPSSKATVLVVEDNQRLLRAIGRTLVESGYSVLPAPDLATARSQVRRTPPNAIVLDILLPDGNGLDFIEEIRAASTAPVLLVTALGTKDQRLAGLRAGGDDYITKPFDLDELCARVGAFLRREAMHHNDPGREIVTGPLRLDPVADRAYLYGKDINLAPKEFSVLFMLVVNEGTPLTAQQLYEAVWKLPMAGDDHSIKNVVYRLRQKLGLANSGLSIETSRGEGYCFRQPVGPI